MRQHPNRKNTLARSDHDHPHTWSIPIMQENKGKMESKLAIDEVSETVGILKTEIHHLKSSDVVIHNKLDKIIDKLTLINGSVGKAHTYIDDMRPDLESAFANGNDWADTKRKAKWLIGLGFLGSAGGGFSLSKFFSGLFS